MKYTVAVLLLLALSPNLSAQIFGGNPPSIKWNQINTDTARIIFPAGLEKQAAEIAGLVHQLPAISSSTIGDRIRKINIVLQNQTTISNGYVALGPYRSEFFLTPRQNSFELGSLPWHKTLALHEYRHVQQFNNFRKGLSKLMYFVFGEEGLGLANGIAVPDWFWEGDAVMQETSLTGQGRGRIPYFFNPYRSLWASGKNYSWMKLRNGSYRDLVPDHYRLGYMLVDYGRQKYGQDIWKKITSDAAAFKGPFYPFQRAIRKYTGTNFRDFRRAAFEHFDYDTEIDDTASSYAKKHKHFAGDEEYPQWMNTQQIVYVKSSYSRIAAFYTRDIRTGEEKKIRTRDISEDHYFSLRSGKIVYTAFHPDPRWGFRNYGTINIVDAITGEQDRIMSRTKYFSPDISDDGQEIIAVEVDPSGKSSVHRISAVSGDVIDELPNTGNFIFTYPKFYNSDTLASAVRNDRGEMAMGLFSLNNGGYRLITPFTTSVKGFTQVNGDTVFFSMSFKGADRLFAWTKDQIFLFRPQWENRSTGNYQLSGKNGRYAWTMFTAAGFHAIEGKGAFDKISSDEFEVLPAGIISSASDRNFAVEKYRKSFRLFNFHSWRPYISDPEYSYSLIGENILNNFQSELFFTYNRNERFKETGASFAYGGLFPVLRAGASFIMDRSAADSAGIVRWNEFNSNIGFRIPLSFTNGSFYQNINFASSFNSRQVYYTGRSKQEFENKKFNFADLSFSFVNQQARALQHIHPRFAQVISLRHRFIINRYTANQFVLNAALYFPGLFKNHSIVLQGSYHRRDTMQQYLFSNIFSLPQGYNDINLPRMWKGGINYHLPLFYPDFGFGNIVYLLRVRSNLFYDYSAIKSLRSGQTFILRSTGTEIYFDTKWWNQLPVSFGIRYSRLIDGQLLGLAANQWELVLPLTLLSR